MVTLNEFLLILNAVSCAATAICLGTFQRKGARHRPLAAFFAWLLTVACGSVTILILTGRYSSANLAETIINVTLCVIVIFAKGNVMRLARPWGENGNGH